MLKKEEMEFKEWKEDGYYQVEKWLKRRPTMLCESNLAYHIIWSSYYKTQYYLNEKGILWLLKLEGLGDISLLPIAKLQDIKEQFELLQRYFTEVLHKKLRVYLVDEMALKWIQPDQEKYQIIEDQESSDYIYDANMLRCLSGRKYCKKKNMVANFLKNYGSCSQYISYHGYLGDDKNRNQNKIKMVTQNIVPIDMKTVKNNDLMICDQNQNTIPMNVENITLEKEKILQFLEKWNQQKKDSDPFQRLKAEEKGIACLFDYVDLAKIRMAGIKINGELKAFTMGTYHPFYRMAVIHVEKADPKIRGLYGYLNQQFLLHEFPETLYVNREDDMGIADLKKSKELYYPIFKTKKYIIQEKNFDES